MTITDRDKERATRVEKLLEELRVNTEDLHELAKRVADHSRRLSREARAGRAAYKARKKR